MIRVLRRISWFLFLAGMLEMLPAGCSERASERVILPDSTIVFPSKKSDGISATITLSRKLNQKSGRQSAIATILPLKKDENIYAVVDLKNRLLNIKNDLMFHIDWIGPDGRSFYLKRIDILPGDSTSLLVSSISVEPEKRPPGEYLVRIYLFRELIAEKHFELRPEPEIEKVQANIIFYKSLDKESGQLTGVDTVFAIRKKGILRAQIGLSNLHVYKDDELPFRLEWAGPDGQSFYSKKIDFQQSDFVSTITGSISITPDKRQPGEYFLRIYLFDDIVGEKKFVLKPSD